MISTPEGLVSIAIGVGMKVPSDLDDYPADDYPHWGLFCLTQLERPLASPQSPQNNAKMIASFSNREIIGITFADIADKLE